MFVCRTDEVGITKLDMEGRSVWVSGEASKVKENCREKNKQKTRRSKGTRDGVALNVLPAATRSRRYRESLDLLAKKRNDVQENINFKGAGWVEYGALDKCMCSYDGY